VIGTPLARDRAIDATIAVFRDPFRFILERARCLGTDAFETRIALRPTICLTGIDGARLFYDPERFERRGAMPEPIQATLFGRGGVQMLDGEAHHHRKASFLALLDGPAIGRLGELADAEWVRAADRWADVDQVPLYDQAKQVLCRAVTAWAGVPVAESEVPGVARSLALLFEGPLALGPTHVASRFARWRLERWLADQIAALRDGSLRPGPGSALDVIARHRDLDGVLLPPRVAAVELLSVLRPTVAVSGFVTYVAMVLHRRPEWRDRILADPGDLDRFVQEVRRSCRFAPFVAARVRRTFEWEGRVFERGRLTLLDLFGIDHDPRIWSEPDRFRPDRFIDRAPSMYDFVPQGGGDVRTGHRCAGEAATIGLLRGAARLLAALSYEVPEQDLRIPRSALPGLPRSGFVISRVRRHHSIARGDGETRRRDAVAVRLGVPSPYFQEER
jgi:fatty-acid peroxygenase